MGLTILILTVTAGWIAYAILDGFYQAFYYDLYPQQRNLHWVYATQRLILTLAIFGTMDGRIPIIDIFIFCFALFFIYSFFHNGEYYATRNDLNPKVYKKRWLSNSETSQSVFEFNIGFRTVMALIGFLFIAGIILQN